MSASPKLGTDEYSHYKEGELIQATTTSFGVAEARIKDAETGDTYVLEVTTGSGFLGKYKEQFDEEFVDQFGVGEDKKNSGSHVGEILEELLVGPDKVESKLRFYFDIEQAEAE